MIQIFKHVQLIYTLYQLVFIFIVITLWLLSNISYTITLVSFSDKTVALWIIEIHFANWKENYMISQVKLGEQDHHFGSYIEIYFSLPVFVDIQMQKLLFWDLCWHMRLGKCNKVLLEIQISKYLGFSVFNPNTIVF